ncbi:DNA adenine methylase [Anaerobacillus isosaccharinicus]|uniref:DNA adenine methylase n=1 Tax=Anaerobacillus isosaccharinicus TaxID=1532552 RepID=A0AC62A4D3_9BACI
MIEMNGPLPGKEGLRFPEKIAAVAERLIGVQIENQPAIELIKRYSRQNVLIYANPPYILSTRTTSSYKHEMTEEDHEELLDVLEDHPGPVILSGYTHPLYDGKLKGWRREQKGLKLKLEQFVKKYMD